MSCCCKGNLHDVTKKERKNQMINNRKVKSIAFSFVLTLSSVLTGQAQITNGIAKVKADGQSAAVLQTSQPPASASGPAGNGIEYHGGPVMVGVIAQMTDLVEVGAANWASIPMASSNGDGSFTVTNLAVDTFATLATSPGVQIVSGDFNGDGKTDLAAIGVASWASVPVAFSTGMDRLP